MSDIFDKAKTLISENTAKAKTLIAENDDKVGDAVDKVAAVVDGTTGRKHTETITTNAEKAKVAIKKFASDER